MFKITSWNYLFISKISWFLHFYNTAFCDISQFYFAEPPHTFLVVFRHLCKIIKTYCFICQLLWTWILITFGGRNMSWKILTVNVPNDHEWNLPTKFFEWDGWYLSFHSRKLLLPKYCDGSFFVILSSAWKFVKTLL